MTGPVLVNELLNLKGRHALITGSGQGIGLSIARRLAQAGASVILHGRKDTTALRDLSEELSALPGGSGLILADLSTSQGCAALMQEVQETNGRLDLLINNAADQGIAALCDLDPDSVTSMLSTNMAAPILLTRDFARQAKPGAAIVNICSIEAIRPSLGHSHYASSKAGLLQFTRAAACELGPKGVRVNAVCPGLIDRQGLNQDWPEGLNRWIENAPLQRIGTSNDVANAVLFLASDASGFITGSSLNVDGGMDCISGW
jgi:NAD(P)-dependent dehydrogenase (short-subunit alcohol dehydrogenase family)